VSKTSNSRLGRSSAKNADWFKEVFKEWADVVEKSDTDLLRINEAPEWVLNAYVECLSVVFPSGMPSPEKWDARFTGEFFGRCYAFEKLFSGEVALGPEITAELNEILARAKAAPKPQNLKLIEKDVAAKFEATRNVLPFASAAATACSYKDAIEFQSGLARGMNIEPEELASSRSLRRHTRTYWVLASMWRVWVKCKSLREVYGYLCQAVGEQRVGSFKTFEKLCKKIGFKLRGRGRPKLRQ